MRAWLGWRRRGFSLIELMAVVLILGMLASVATLTVRSYLVAGKQNIARVEIQRLSQAIETFNATYGRYPRTDEGLAVLVEPSEKFVDGLLSKVPTDPWGNAYEYNQPGRNAPYEVLCYGEDNREGGTGADADIRSDDLAAAP